MNDSPDRAGRSQQPAEHQRPAPASGPGTGESGALPNLGEIMGQVARSLQEEHGDVQATLEAITAAAVHSVPGTDECGVTLVRERRRVESRAPTGELPRDIDVQLGERGIGRAIEHAAQATGRTHKLGGLSVAQMDGRASSAPVAVT